MFVFARVGPALAVAILAATFATTSSGRLPADCPSGEWIRSQTAAWLRRAVQVAGYRVEDCTGSAWIAATPRTSFYVWATEGWRPSPEYRPYTGASSLPLPTFTDGTRIVWEAQGLGIWLEAGPSRSDVLPGRTVLGWLQIASKNLPRRYRPVELMAMPPAALARCRRDRRLRPACPTRIPRIPGWETYPRRAAGIFGIQLGGEIPGRPELMRPPHVLHLEVAVDPDHWVAWRWPTTGAVAPRDGLMRRARSQPLLLGRITWAGRRGSVALAPAFPNGGSQGNHVIFRWRRGRETYVVGLHAWEPFREAYATLRRVVATLPPQATTR